MRRASHQVYLAECVASLADGGDDLSQAVRLSGCGRARCDEGTERAERIISNAATFQRSCVQRAYPRITALLVSRRPTRAGQFV